MGTQLPVAGGQWRWTTAQNVLALLRTKAQHLAQTFGGNEVECSEEASQEFPNLRFLERSAYTYLCRFVMRDILEGKTAGLTPGSPEIETCRTHPICHERGSGRSND